MSTTRSPSSTALGTTSVTLTSCGPTSRVQDPPQRQPGNCQHQEHRRQASQPLHRFRLVDRPAVRGRNPGESGDITGAGDDGPRQAPVKEGDVVAGKYRVERSDRQRRHGRRLRRAPPAARRARRPQVRHRRPGRRPGGHRPHDARGARHLPPPQRAHGARLDVGELPSGPLYIVMELLEGRDLKAELEARGPLPEKEVVQLRARGVRGARRGARRSASSTATSSRTTCSSPAPRAGHACSRCSTSACPSSTRSIVRGGPPHAPRDGPRHAALHGARAVEVRGGVDAPRRHLGARRRDVRAADGRGAAGKLRGAERQARLLAGAIPDAARAAARADRVGRAGHHALPARRPRGALALGRAPARRRCATRTRSSRRAPERPR